MIVLGATDEMWIMQEEIFGPDPDLPPDRRSYRLHQCATAAIGALLFRRQR
jgi:hypothetical protein